VKGHEGPTSFGRENQAAGKRGKKLCISERRSKSFRRSKKRLFIKVRKVRKV